MRSLRVIVIEDGCFCKKISASAFLLFFFLNIPFFFV
jgi:hypothetical protein